MVVMYSCYVSSINDTGAEVQLESCLSGGEQTSCSLDLRVSTYGSSPVLQYCVVALVMVTNECTVKCTLDL